MAHLTHVIPLTSVHLHVSLKVIESGALVVTLVTLVAAWCPMVMYTVHVQASLLAKDLPTGWTLMLWVPGGRPCVHLLLMHLGLQQTTEHFATL